MSAIIGGTHLIDLWLGPVPAQVKSTVELQYRPGQSTAAAKILPSQSHQSQFTAVQYRALAGAHAYVDGLRALIGTQQTLTFAGENYQSVLIVDITPSAIEHIVHASGVHPDGAAFDHSPAAKITTQWTIARLS